MRHPLFDIEVPAVFDRLAAHIADKGCGRASHALGGVDPHSWLEAPPRGPGEDMLLDDPGFPFELVPFGNRSEVFYGLVVHDPSLTPTCASWAPEDEDACWLADDAEQALAHLLGVAVRDAALHLGPDEAEAEVTEKARELAEELAAALGVPIATDIEMLSEGARSERLPDVVAPDGWLFEQCNDGIGVLAPASTFDPDLEPIEEGSLFDLAQDLARADDLLARGFPGSALAEARNTYHAMALEEEHLDAVERMRAAYVALGRDFLVRRVDRYVARHRDAET